MRGDVFWTHHIGPPPDRACKDDQLLLLLDDTLPMAQ